MKYGVSGKVKKAIAIAISIALVICAVPAMPVSAGETTAGAAVIKQVNFGVADDAAAPGINKDKITLSISSGFTKGLSMAYSKVGNETSSNAANWILASKDSENSMEASVKGDKIILADGYWQKSDYPSYRIKAEHKKASDVLAGATEVSAIISTQDNEILYYGKIDSDTSVSSTSSCFIIPKELGKGSYNLYIFAEACNNASPKTVSTSSLGEPIEIEVVSSPEFDITGIEEPEPGSTPDENAVLKVKDGNNVIWEDDINVKWQDDYGNGFTKFLYNRDYNVAACLDEYITGYIFEENIIKINDKEAELTTSQYGDYTTYNVYRSYKTASAYDVNISGSVGTDNSITLKAYKGIIPPGPSSSPDTESTFEWWNPSKNTSLPAYTGQSHVLTSDDFDIDMILKVNTAGQDNVASKVITIRSGLLETSVIEGVSKTDESVKGKADGSLEGLTSEMAYSLDGGNTYNTCTSGALESIKAGTECYVKIEKNNLVPAGVTGIYAKYKIGEGSSLIVSFDCNGGSGVNAIEDVSYNSIIKEPAVPIKEGFSFGGWYKDGTFNDKWDFSKDKVTKNVCLFAKWNKNQAENPGGVTTEPEDTTKPEGTTEPEDTTKPEGTTKPEDTTKPDGTTKPEDTTKPEGTIEPEGTTEPTKKPSGSNNVLLPYVPSVTSTQAPSSIHETKSPVQTAVPENKPSQNPETGTDKVPEEPEVQASQTPQGVNPGEDNTPAGTNQPVSVLEEGSKFVSENIEFQSTGDGNVIISGIDTNVNKNIVIPDIVVIDGKEYKVTKIAGNAFAGSDVKSVELGSNITEIGDGAFKGCKNLKTVKCSSGIKVIGKEAFKDCIILDNVELGDNITSLGDRAFRGCAKLENIKIPEGLVTIGQGAFRNCISLKKIKLPSSVKSIGKKAFKNCKSMKTFTLGTAKKKNVKSSNKKLALRFGANVAKVSIGASALENCVDLRSVVINSQVTKIGNSTFRYCTQLRRMLVKSLKLQKVGNKALQGVHNCKITVPPVKIKPYTTLFKNKGQGKKVVVAKS